MMEKKYCIGDQETGKMGVIDKTGRQVIPLIYDKLEWLWYRSDYILAQKSSKLGIIDINGDVILPVTYDDDEIEINETEKTVFVKRGNAWEPIDLDASPISKHTETETCKYSIVDKEGAFGVVDDVGDEVIQCIYEDIKSLGDGVFAVKENGKWGISKVMGLCGEWVEVDLESMCPFDIRKLGWGTHREREQL